MFAAFDIDFNSELLSIIGENKEYYNYVKL